MADRQKRRVPEESWSPQDQAMYLTCLIIDDIIHRRVPAIRAQTMFAMKPGSAAFVSGPTRVDELRAAGDGSYSRSGGFVFGTGTLGMALVAGSLIGNAVSNNRARNQAMANAQVTFRHQFDGTLFACNDGWIFHTAQGVYNWDFGSVGAMQVIAPNTVLMQGQSDRGPLTWRIISPYAELIFVLWALERHPQHPQLVDGSWLSSEWIAFARSHGRDPRIPSGVLARPEQQIRLPGQQNQLQPGPPHLPPR